MARTFKRRGKSGGVRRSARASRSGYNSGGRSGAVTHRLVIQVAQPAPSITGAELASGRIKVSTAQPRNTKSIF